MEEEDSAFSVIEEAFARSDLPKLERKPDLVNPLGMEDFDWFVLNMLQGAGITVECLGAGAEGALKYQAMQIVDEYDMQEALKVTELQNIAHVDMDNMLGLQVKLNGIWHWKVTVVEENLEQHGGLSSRLARGRAGGAAKTSSFENRHLYEIATVVPREGGGVKCSAAVAGGITINIAFQYNKVAQDGVKHSLWKNNSPLISQRRIDIVFTNQYMTSIQVCVPERVAEHRQNVRCSGTYRVSCLLRAFVLRPFGMTRVRSSKTRGADS